MCLIAFSYRQSEKYPLVLIANRDESYARASRAAAFWEGEAGILGGRDLEKGGTWLGINRHGRFAAVTNYRDGLVEKSSSRSRGLLVSEYLQQTGCVEDYLQHSIDSADQYGDFNLLLGDTRSVYFLNSREAEYRELSKGSYALSNGHLDSNWPKMKRAREEIDGRVQGQQALEHEALLDVLSDRRIARDEDLPNTNVGLELERKLSPIFIAGENYGTRVSTVLTIDSSHEVLLSERSYNSEAEIDGECHYRFLIEGGKQ